MVLGKYDLIRNSSRNEIVASAGELLNLSSYRGLGDAIVPALAGSGFLGPVRLLPPHQSEFLRNRKRNFGFEGLGSPLLHSRTLAIELVERLKGGHIPMHTNYHRYGTDHELLIAVDAHVPEKRFLLLKDLQGHPANVNHHIAKKHLELVPYTQDDFSGMLSDSSFPEMLEYMDGVRPNHALQNFADTMALLYLNHLVDDLRKRYLSQDFERNPLNVPRFFLTKDADVLRSTIKKFRLDEALTYDLKHLGLASKSSPVSVLQEWPYFFAHGIGGTMYGMQAEQGENPSFVEAQRKELASNFTETFGRLVNVEFFKDWIPIFDSGVTEKMVITNVVDSAFFKSVLEPVFAKEREMTLGLWKVQDTVLEEVTTLDSFNELTSKSVSDDLTRLHPVYRIVQVDLRRRFLPIEETLGDEEVEDVLWAGLRLSNLVLPESVRRRILGWLTTIWNVGRSRSTEKQREAVWKELSSAYTGFRPESVTRIQRISLAALLIAFREENLYGKALQLLHKAGHRRSFYTSLMVFYCFIMKGSDKSISSTDNYLVDLKNLADRSSAEAFLGMSYAYNLAALQFEAWYGADADIDDGVPSTWWNKAIELGRAGSLKGFNEEITIACLNSMLYASWKCERWDKAEEAARALLSRKGSGARLLPHCDGTLLEYCIELAKRTPPDDNAELRSILIRFSSAADSLRKWPRFGDLSEIFLDYQKLRRKAGLDLIHAPEMGM